MVKSRKVKRVNLINFMLSSHIFYTYTFNYLKASKSNFSKTVILTIGVPIEMALPITTVVHGNPSPGFKT